jgi:hypothetical protein
MSPVDLNEKTAMAILVGDDDRIRREARQHYLRSLDLEELLDWLGECTYAAAIAHPKGSTVLTAHVQSVLDFVEANRTDGRSRNDRAR